MEFKTLDYLNIRPSIYIKGKLRYQSGLGAVLPILSVCSIASLAFYFIVDFIQKKELNVIFFQDSNNFVASIDLNQKLLLFRYVDIDNKPIDPRIGSLLVT
jgi:hypothetical protein